MATLAATEPVICPNAIPEPAVPTCMFAPERGRGDEPSGADGFEDCDGTNGDSADHLDLSSKVGLVASAGCCGPTLTSFLPVSVLKVRFYCAGCLHSDTYVTVQLARLH